MSTKPGQLHHAELDWTIWAYFKDSPYKVASESNESGTEHRVYVEFEEEPDFLVWGNLLAEFAYNLRSGLDQLIYILSREENGGSFDPASGRRMPGHVKFPIYVTDKTCNVDGREIRGYYRDGTGQPSELNKIRNPEVREAIKEVQPFHTHPDNPEQNPFWIINELSNTDKHRQTLPVFIRPTFDYPMQAGLGTNIDGLTWEPADYRGQADTTVGHFKTSPGHEIKVQGRFMLVPAVEAFRHVAVDTFETTMAASRGLSVLPFSLEDAVTDLVEKIRNIAGWDEDIIVGLGLISQPGDMALERRWLPGRFRFVNPFIPTDGFGSPARRFW